MLVNVNLNYNLHTHTHMHVHINCEVIFDNKKINKIREVNNHNSWQEADNNNMDEFIEVFYWFL